MKDKRKIGRLVLCECGRVKGLHGWLEMDKMNMAKLILKADAIVSEECDICVNIRERWSMLREASEGCSCCGEPSWEEV